MLRGGCSWDMHTVYCVVIRVICTYVIDLPAYSHLLSGIPKCTVIVCMHMIRTCAMAIPLDSPIFRRYSAYGCPNYDDIIGDGSQQPRPRDVLFPFPPSESAP